MGATEAGNLATVIRETYYPGFSEAVFRNDMFMRQFGAPIDSGGDTSHRWKVNSAGNDSVQTYNEGDSALPAGEQTYVNAAVPYTHFRFMVEVSGHARAAMRSAWFNGIEEEMTLGLKDLRHLMNTTYINGTNGMSTAVDSASTYAGIARGSASYFESYETALNSLPTHTALEDAVEFLADASRGATLENLMWMLPWNQATNVYRITAQPNVQLNLSGDKIPQLIDYPIAGRPVTRVPNMTTTEIYLLDMSPENWHLIEHEGFTVHDQGRSDDGDLYMVTYRGALCCCRPKLQLKYTAVTA